MNRLLGVLRQATVADVLLLLAAAGLATALLSPSWSGRVFQARVTEAIAGVDSLTESARSARLASGFWPETVPRESPTADPEAPAGPPSGSRDGYSLGWTTWEVVDYVEARSDSPTAPSPGGTGADVVVPSSEPAPRTVGAVTVHTSEEALIAELLAHYGDQASFTIDSVWLLVLPERSPSP